MTPEQQIVLGHKAEACREVLDAALDRVERALVTKLKAIPLSNVEEIRGAHASLSVIEGIRAAVIEQITPAQIARAEQPE